MQSTVLGYLLEWKWEAHKATAKAKQAKGNKGAREWACEFISRCVCVFICAHVSLHIHILLAATVPSIIIVITE